MAVVSAKLCVYSVDSWNNKWECRSCDYEVELNPMTASLYTAPRTNVNMLLMMTGMSMVHHVELGCEWVGVSWGLQEGVCTTS